MKQKSKSILIISIVAFSLIFGMFGCQTADKTVNETKPVENKVPEKKGEEMLNSLIKNGNFVQNTAYWTFGANVGSAGGAATATVEDGVLRIDIGSPGSATYAIQLIQAPIEIIYGLRYRVSFDAKASEDSAIEVKVGGVENRGWADYTKGESIGGTIVYLTTQMENHSIEFGMEEMTDPKARLEFQLGNISTSSIWLDNIKVEVIGKNTGKSVDPTLWVPNPNKIIIPKIKNRGAKLPFIQYEAENAATNGVILGPNRKFKEIPNEASNKMAVNLDSTDDYVEFTLKEKTNSLVIRYCIPDSNGGKGLTYPLSLYVNGTYKQDIILTSEYAWVYGRYPWSNNPELKYPRYFFDEVNILLPEIPAGSKLKLQRDSKEKIDFCIIDLIDTEVVGDPLTMPENFLSITDFGAVPDDGKDDNDAFNACLKSAIEQKKGVWMPAGVFNFSSSQRYIGNVVLRGAGMWHTVMKVDGNTFWGNGNSFEMHDFAIYGNTKFRIDTIAEDGFRGGAGRGSLIENIWFNHLKVGVWSESNTDGLIIRNCRFRNLMADGINFCLGTKNSIVENCHFRGTGDDAIAMWSATYNGNLLPSENDTARFNTIQCPWLANGIAIYGGRNHTVEDNVIYDTIVNGAGININTNYNPVPFSGFITVQKNTLIRCGSYTDKYKSPTKGAICICTSGSRGIEADLTMKDIEIYDASYDAITFEGTNRVLNAKFENILINGAGKWGIRAAGKSAGLASFTNVKIQNAVSGPVTVDSKTFTIEKKEGNVGW
jgi:hypothetical protein